MDRWTRQYPYAIEREKLLDKLKEQQDAIRNYKSKILETERSLQSAHAENMQLRESASGHARQALQSEETARTSGEAARQSGEAAKQSADAATFLSEQCQFLEKRMEEERAQMQMMLTRVEDERKRLDQKLAMQTQTLEEANAQHAAAARAWNEQGNRSEAERMRTEERLSSALDENRKLQDQASSLSKRVEQMQVDTKAQQASIDLDARRTETALTQEVRRMEVRAVQAEERIASAEFKCQVAQKECNTAVSARDTALTERRAAEDALRAATTREELTALKTAASEAKAASDLKDLREAMERLEASRLAASEGLAKKEKEASHLQGELNHAVHVNAELQAQSESLIEEVRLADKRIREIEAARKSEVNDLSARIKSEVADFSARISQERGVAHDAELARRQLAEKLEADRSFRREEKIEDGNAIRTLEQALERERFAHERERTAHAGCEAHRQELLAALGSPITVPPPHQRASPHAHHEMAEPNAPTMPSHPVQYHQARSGWVGARLPSPSSPGYAPPPMPSIGWANQHHPYL
jgi:hypothetical protein